MPTDRWNTMKALFLAALEQPAAERDHWLTAATPDEAVREEVRALLRAHDTAGTFLEDVPLLDPPAQIGPYRIERELGRGGMGVVYLAHDSRLDRPVALKALPPLASVDPSLRERLRREARAAATVAHTGVAIVYSLEEVDGELFIASEYVRGVTLRELIAAGPLPVPRAIGIAVQIAAALAAAHAAGVVHRDLKPENVVVGTGDAIKIVDFGIAQLTSELGARLTRPGAAIGTPAYMAPEQVAGLGTDARTDLYAAGLILAEMLTGVHPLSPTAPPVPAEAAAIVRRCLAAEPHARYESALDLLEDLSAIGNGPRRSAAHIWWAVHQAVVVVVYGTLIVPMWSARELIGGASGRALFLIALATAIIASALRLHRWFTSRWYPGEFGHVRQRSAAVLFGADTLFAIALISTGIAVSGVNDTLAAILVSFGAGVAVAFAAIEPATARAAFRASAEPQA